MKVILVVVVDVDVVVEVGGDGGGVAFQAWGHVAECVGHLPPTLKVWSAAGPRPAVAQVLQLL